MARNSFQLKAWALTIVTATLALAGAQNDARIAFAGIVPVIGFWLLDAYYLRQERLFRKLFDHARTDAGDATFSMNTKPFESEVASLIGVAFSRTIWPCYGSLTIAVLLSTVFLSAGSAVGAPEPHGHHGH